MRYREFKILTENQIVDPKNLAPELQKAAQNSKDNPQKTSQLQNLISYLTKKAKEILQTNKSQNDTVTTEATADATLDILDVYVKQMDPKELAQFSKELQNPKVKQLLNALVTKRKEVAGSIKSFVQRLVNKVTGSLDAIKDAYDEQRAEGDVDVPVKPRGQSVAEQLNIILTGLAKYTPTDKQPKLVDFLKKCADSGIIDLTKLPETGNIKELANQSKFADLLQTPVDIQGIKQPFLQAILQSKPAGTGAAAWGPGEAGLAILGTPVQKADTKGDLSIGGEKIEMKASSIKEKGGRISSEAVKSGKDAVKDVTPILDKFLTFCKVKRTGKAVPSAFPKKKPFNIYNLGTTWFTNVNEYIRKNKIKNQIVIKLLNDVSETAINKAVVKKELPFDYSKAVTPQGEIVSALVMKEYLRVTMGYYNQIEQVTKILILNPGTGNFTTINATDIGGAYKKITQDAKSPGKVYTSSHVMDFSGNQAKISPQLGIA